MAAVTRTPPTGPRMLRGSDGQPPRPAPEVPVELIGNFLVVTQSQPGHRRTSELIDQLRRAASIEE